MQLGPFELVERIARGATGEVWRAVRTGEGGFRREVAVKILRHRTDEDPFLREARLGARVEHPNVAAVLSVGRDDGRLWIEEELVRGHDLEAILHAGVPPPAIGLYVAAEILAGLAHVHARGLRHGDLRPAHVLVSTEGQVKIVGLSLDGSPRADLFAAGLILRELCPGGAILGRFLARGARFQSADEALAAVRALGPASADELASWLAGAMPTQVPRRRRRRRRKRRLWLLLAGALFGAAAGLALRLLH